VAHLRNASGRPLAGSSWLTAHHKAKLPERHAFGRRLANLAPSSIVDIGCGPGLWLDELDAVMPADCEFIGVDSDDVSLEEARERAVGWAHAARFDRVDVDLDPRAVPKADLTLLFNISPYLRNLDGLLAELAERGGHVAVRQYDGAAMRFGPMRTEERAIIEESLRVALLSSDQFRHYDLDRVYAAIKRAPFRSQDVAFELFQRTSPFPPEFADYYAHTTQWMLDYLSESGAECLRAWLAAREANPDLPSYWVEVDLTAVLS
jgi:SAM-dependent methyltransferase